MVGRWEHFSHDADIGVRGIAEDVADAFAQAALALTAVITDPDGVAPRRAVQLSCEAPDDELLLYDWLNAVVYEMATRGMLFARFAVRIDGDRLEGAAWGEKVDVARHRPAVEIKGATLTELAVRRSDGAWIAQCVIDI
jgi:SHS2 domain-containing protein